MGSLSADICTSTLRLVRIRKLSVFAEPMSPSETSVPNTDIHAGLQKCTYGASSNCVFSKLSTSVWRTVWLSSFTTFPSQGFFSKSSWYPRESNEPCLKNACTDLYIRKLCLPFQEVNMTFKAILTMPESNPILYWDFLRVMDLALVELI